MNVYGDGFDRALTWFAGVMMVASVVLIIYVIAGTITGTVH